MCGDVEKDHGPDDINEKLSPHLAFVVKSITVYIDSHHDVLGIMLNEVKKSDVALEQTASNINTRLAAIEYRADNLDQCRNTGLQQIVSDAIRDKNAELQRRLDNLEGHSRSNNQIFYGLIDSASES